MRSTPSSTAHSPSSRSTACSSPRWCWKCLAVRCHSGGGGTCAYVHTLITHKTINQPLLSFHQEKNAAFIKAWTCGRKMDNRIRRPLTSPPSPSSYLKQQNTTLNTTRTSGFTVTRYTDLLLVSAAL